VVRGQLARENQPRTLDHNARLHGMCRDISKHVVWAERKWDEETWKRIFLGAKFGQAVIPDPFGGGYPVVVNKRRSSRLTNAMIEELLGEIQAFGDEHSVPWSAVED
jgi:hypothetical protein